VNIVIKLWITQNASQRGLSCNNLKYRTFSLGTSFNVRYHVSYPYKTRGKIRELYTSIFMFLDRTDPCQHGNEPSGFIQGGQSLDQLSDC